MRKKSCVVATVLCALAATSAAQEQVWSIAPEGSQVRIDVGKSGLFSAAGQTHEVIAPAVSGHGVTRRIEAPVEVEMASKRLTGTVKAVVKQTDFGIESVSAGFGTVKVKNEVSVTFTFLAQP